MYLENGVSSLDGRAASDKACGGSGSSASSYCSTKANSILSWESTTVGELILSTIQAFSLSKYILQTLNWDHLGAVN